MTLKVREGNKKWGRDRKSGGEKPKMTEGEPGSEAGTQKAGEGHQK